MQDNYFYFADPNSRSRFTTNQNYFVKLKLPNASYKNNFLKHIKNKD